MLIVQPVPIFNLATSGGALSNGTPGTGAANFYTPDPKEVWSDGGGGGVHNIDLDLGSTHRIDTFFLGFVGGAPEATTQVGAGGQLLDSGLAPATRAGVTRRHMLVRALVPVLARYVTFSINSQTTAVMTIGVAAVGLAFQPRYNREWGGGRRPIDTGSVEPLSGGGFGIGDGTVKSSFRWTLGDLDEEELDRLDELAMDRGNRRPVIVVEDPVVDARLHQRIHYGLLDRFEFYERAKASKNRWAMGVTDWV